MDELETLSEAVFETTADGRMMANVRLIKAGTSKNKRTYRAKALEEAVDNHKFDGVRMFTNHGAQPGPTLKRSLKDMVSAIESTTYNKATEAVDGRVEFFDEKFYDYTKRAKNFMGASINAGLRGTRSRDRTGAVEEDIHQIERVHSVDWVIYPSAGGEILGFEAIEDGAEDMEIDWTKITLEDLKAKAPAIFEAIKAEVAPKEPEKGEKGYMSPEEVDAKIKLALESHANEVKLIEGKHKIAAEAIRAEFAKSGLPEKTKARVMAGFESEMEFNDEVKTRIETSVTEAKAELTAVGAGPHIRGEGMTGNEGDGHTKARSFSVMESVEASFGITKEDPKEGTK